MTDVNLTVQELDNTSKDPRVALILNRGESEVLRREVRVFSEDDIIAASDAMTGTGAIAQVDIDQGIAELIEPIRNRWLRSRDGLPEEGAVEGAQAVPPRYVAVECGEGATGIRDAHHDRTLCNFVLVLDEDVEVQDDIESAREFRGKLTTASATSPFRIPAADYADNARLKAALFATGGCELVIHCNMDELRRAVSTISTASGQIRRRRLTTNFGWMADRTAYMTPSLRISRDGIEPLDDGSELRVDLKTETPACHLDLKKLDDAELLRVKRHVVEDLLRVHDRVVTQTLLGAVAAAVLYPYAKGAGRFALWLVGLTGNGKSFSAKLFSNFFGDFPVSSAPFTTWSATPNYVQRQGYFFKDALFLVDDYKPEVVQPYQVVRVLQTYADNTARGRLKSDATANVLRPIRGLLVCTGEDVPEHNASSIARSIIVKAPQQGKNPDAGNRCLAECDRYAGVTADFIRWLLAGGRPDGFVRRFGELQARYYGDVAGQQNDIRVATNLALLGAAFELFAEYLGDVWEGWQEAVRKFVDEDLVAIRDGMLGEAREQQASEVFLRTLAELIRFGHVRLLGDAHQPDNPGATVIGRVRGLRSTPGVRPGTGSGQDELEICTSLALAQVNGCLRQQGRPELKITERTLLQQLREDGRLLDQTGEPLAPGAEPTRRVRLDDGRQVRAFAIRRQELLGEGAG